MAEIDWTQSMQQTYEYYTVNPNTWQDDEQLTSVISSEIKRDVDDETLGYATIETSEAIDDCYIRIYLSTIQNGYHFRECLGTFLIETPSTKFDGKYQTISLDGYTPLIELKENLPPLGYTIKLETNIMDETTEITKEHVRAPVVDASCDELLYEDFVANLDDTWLSFLSDFMAEAKYTFALDEVGRILFAPDQELEALQPVMEFDDDNSSILLPDVEDEHDLYDVPNVVEVVYSLDSGFMYSRVENNDENSPISIQNRGREIVYRDSNPSLPGLPTQNALDDYATLLLKSKSSLEHTITFSHGYYPVRLNDCVLLNYKRAGLRNVKARITSQSIKCETGCTIEETAVYTTNLWE